MLCYAVLCRAALCCAKTCCAALYCSFCSMLCLCVPHLDVLWFHHTAGHHHAASPREPDPAVSHSAKCDGVCRLGGPHQTAPAVCVWHAEAACSSGAQPVLQWPVVQHLPARHVPRGGVFQQCRSCFVCCWGDLISSPALLPESFPGSALWSVVSSTDATLGAHCRKGTFLVRCF